MTLEMVAVGEKAFDHIDKADSLVNKMIDGESDYHILIEAAGIKKDMAKLMIRIRNFINDDENFDNVSKNI